MRPAFVLLVAYCAYLCWAREGGPFCAPPEKTLYAARSGARFSARLVSPPREDSRGLWAEAELLEHPGQLARLRWRNTALFDAPRPGETIDVSCGLRRPFAGKNPGDFNERALLEDRGVQWTADCAAPLSAQAARTPFDQLRSSAETLRRRLERSWRAQLSALDARMMAGLALGFKGPLDRELNHQAQDAGVIHLLVPSGAKVAFVLLIVGALASLTRAPPWPRCAAGFVAAGFFTVLVGGEPPYVRAWLSHVYMETARAAGRDADAFQAAVISAWLQLLWDPAALFTLGFQMSWTCAFVLACAMRRKNALLVTALVEAALWPIFASGFHRAAVVGALANVVLVPASVPLVGLGWFTGLVACPPAAKLLALGLAVFRWICARASALPGAAVELAPMSGVETAAFYIALGALLFKMTLRVRCLVAALALTIVLGEAALARRTAPALSVLYLSRPGFRPAALVRRGLKPPLVLTDRRAEAQLRRAARAYGWGEPGEVISLKDRPGYLACEGRVCLRFDQPCFHGPSGEFCILALLKKHAVEASTDGSSVQLRQASNQLRRRLL